MKLGVADDSGNKKIDEFKSVQFDEVEPVVPVGWTKHSTGNHQKNLHSFTPGFNPSSDVSHKESDNSFHEYDYTLAELQARQKSIVKRAYLADVLHTDDTHLWYKKKVAAITNTTDDDTAYDDAIQYWKEGNDEYETKKAAILAETIKDDVSNHEYDPTHP